MKYIINYLKLKEKIKLDKMKQNKIKYRYYPKILYIIKYRNKKLY